MGDGVLTNSLASLCKAADEGSFFKIIVESMQEAVFVLQDENISYANSFALSLTGYSEQELISTPFLTIIEEGFQEEIRQIIILGKGCGDKCNHHEMQIVRKDGGMRWVSCCVRMIQFNNDSLRLCIATDITEQKDLNEALRVNKERWLFALEGSGDGVWDYNFLTGVNTVSKRLKEILGFDMSLPDADFYLNDWAERLHPNSQAQTMHLFQDILDNKTDIYAIEQQVRSESGEYVWLLTRGKVIDRSETGNPTRLIGTAGDITEFKMMKESQKQLMNYNELLEKEVVSRTKALRQAKDKANHASAEKTRFLASASHDLRQPMQAMSLYIEILSQRLKQSRNIEMIVALRDSHSSMGRIMDALLDISKLDAGVFEPNLKPIKLNMLIDDLIRNYSLVAEKKKIDLRARLTCCDVESDFTMLECILNNLISNAICYTENHGKILVACRCRQGKVLVEVRDTGIGIPEEQMEKIFDEFYQLGNPERDRNKGLGLGLSIVSRMVHLLPGHEIDVRSRPGHGSCFRITLPKTESVEAISAPAGFALPNESFTGMRVLIVEDDATIRKSAAILMQEWGCEVMIAGNSDEALGIVKDGWMPDALIADYRLPGGVTGSQVIQKIRTLFEKQIPAMVMTGETQEEVLQEIVSPSVFMLQKPVTPAKFKLFLRQSRH